MNIIYRKYLYLLTLCITTCLKKGLHKGVVRVLGARPPTV